jgi:hypothetical protein
VSQPWPAPEPAPQDRSERPPAPGSGTAWRSARPEAARPPAAAPDSLKGRPAGCARSGCGHPYSAHAHHRAGEECALCRGCPGWLEPREGLLSPGALGWAGTAIAAAGLCWWAAGGSGWALGIAAAGVALIWRAGS